MTMSEWEMQLIEAAKPYMGYRLGQRSMGRLHGVHEDLRAVVELAIRKTVVDFGVSEGVRTERRQKDLYDAGASRTMNSRHLTGHAVDLMAYIGSEASWDWPLYTKISWAMKAAAADLGIALQWGGDWKELKDGPHYELSWKEYPRDDHSG